MRVETGDRRTFRVIDRSATRGWLAGVLCVVALAASARADVTGSYDGTVAMIGAGGSGVATSGLIDSGGAVSGTLAVSVSDPAASGIYWVTGKSPGKGKVIKLSGLNESGTLLKYKGKANAGGFTGKAKFTTAAGKSKGTLVLLRRRA